MLLGQTIVVGLVAGSIYALLALGVVLVYRGSKVLNFAQAEIGTAAAFVCYLLIAKARLPFPLAAALAVAWAVAAGVLFERLVVSRLAQAPRVTVAVATVGLFLTILSLELYIVGAQSLPLPAPIGGRGFDLFGVIVSPTQVLSLILVAAVGVALTLLLRRSDFGLGVLAAADDPQAVQLVGVRLWQVSAFTWGAGAGLAAIAALLIAPTVGGVSPGFTGRLFVYALAAALVGGLSSLQGALLGGLVVGLVDAIARKIEIENINGLPTTVVFALVLIVLLFRPQGLLTRAGAR